MDVGIANPLFLMNGKLLIRTLIISSLLLICDSTKVKGQIIPDETLGSESSLIKQQENTNRTIIEGGAIRNSNLFHSFQEFNVNQGINVYFANPSQVQNIFSRITGNNISNILGTLGVLGKANFFLLNPNGIIFGPNAKLDLKGSFIGSTGERIRFADGTTFSAINPENQSLLTVSIPIGIEFRHNTGRIVIQGQGNNLGFNDNNDSVIVGQRNTGLEISEGKTLAFFGSDILMDGGNLTAESGNIELWSVKIGDLNFQLGNNSLTVPKSQSIVDYGDINLSNASSIYVDGESLSGINLYSQNLYLTDGSGIISLTKGKITGGNITVNASELVQIQGVSTNQFPGGLFAQTSEESKAGNIRVNTRQLKLEGASILTNSYGAGNAGILNLSASESIELTDNNLDDKVSGGEIFADTYSSGNAGNVNIETKNLFLLQGGQISSGTRGTGNAGNLEIKVGDSVQIIGEGDQFPSGLFAQTGSIGNGGSLKITTRRLIVKDGGTISVSSTSRGEGGELTIKADDSVELIGTRLDGRGSRLLSGTVGSGNSGNIIVDTGTLTIRDGAEISVSSVFGTFVGKGTPGNLQVTANSIFLNNQGRIRAESGSGEGGNISLQATDRLELRNESRISATAGTEGGGGNGGNIFIDTPFIIAPPQGNSDITANAFEGQGGNIIVNTQGIFGIEFREAQTLFSDITASSQFGRSGNVEISTPNVNPSQGLVELVKNPVNPADLVKVNACSQGQKSEFTITGRGGLPPNPISLLNSDFMLADFGISTSPHVKDNSNTKIPAQGWKVVGDNEMVLTDNTQNTHLISMGITHYENGEFNQAIAVWQSALQEFVNQDDRLHQAIVLNNLAIAYKELGQWQQAEDSIQKSQENLTSESNSALKLSIQAQSLNNQGILELAQGNPLQALKSWQSATQIYAQIGDESGVRRSLINQGKALQYLGLNLQAEKLLQQVNENLEAESDPRIKVIGWQNYGDVLRLVGKLDQSEKILQKSLKIAQDNLSLRYINGIKLSLGNLYFTQNELRKAFDYYQEATTANANTFLELKVQTDLNKLKVLIQEKRLFSLKNLLPELNTQISNLPPSHTSIYAQINFANSLNSISKITADYDFFDAIKILENALKQAREMGDKRAEAYILTYLGNQYEQQTKLAEAEKFTKSALIIIGQIQAEDIAYLAQWQLARILKLNNDKEGAIIAYNLAFNTLQNLRNDLVTVNQEVQFSFRESVEPIYRELVALLLDGDVSQTNLTQARQIMESLQLAELDNFFQDTCSTTKPVQIDQIDSTTAVIYPIILPDRLDVIVSLPAQPLIHYSTPLNQNQVEDVVNNLQKALFEDPIYMGSFATDYKKNAQVLYQALIKPVETKLQSNQIKNLTFILDGGLRNIPMAILYDGEKHLLETYSVALTPGLQLLDPQPLKRTQLKALTAGLTEARQDFTALPNVKIELTEIEQQIKSKILLNQEFTTTNLEQAIQNNNFPVLHLATHGQFSSNIEDTFILTWDSSINTNDLYRLLSQDFSSNSEPLELLVLSACQTAAGDDRAALGLAGIAVRAGARSTLATLWLVDDEATTELMVKFYQELAQADDTKAESLRQAQLSLLRDGKHKHPFFWAPFVLVGNWL